MITSLIHLSSSGLSNTPMVLVQWADAQRFFDQWTCQTGKGTDVVEFSGADQKDCKIGIANTNGTIPKPQVNYKILTEVLKHKSLNIFSK